MHRAHATRRGPLPAPGSVAHPVGVVDLHHTRVEERARGVDPTEARRADQWGVGTPAAAGGARPVLEEHLHQGHVAAGRGECQRRVAAHVGMVDIEPGLQQRARVLGMSKVDRRHQK